MNRIYYIGGSPCAGKRDVLFAEYVRESAISLGYETITVDGKENVDEILLKVKKIFRLPD